MVYDKYTIDDIHLKIQAGLSRFGHSEMSRLPSASQQFYSSLKSSFNEHENFIRTCQQSQSQFLNHDLLHNGFIKLDRFVNSSDLGPLRNPFLMVRSLFSKEIFYNYQSKKKVHISLVNRIKDLISEFNYDDNFFSKPNLQITTSPKNISHGRFSDVAEFHCDLLKPNLKAFMSLNEHDRKTGYYKILDVREVHHSDLFLRAACCELSMLLSRRAKTANCLTERYQRSLLRQYFKDEFWHSTLKLDNQF